MNKPGREEGSFARLQMHLYCEGDVAGGERKQIDRTSRRFAFPVRVSRVKSPHIQRERDVSETRRKYHIESDYEYHKSVSFSLE